jgi:hypothetical protein
VGVGGAARCDIKAGGRPRWLGWREVMVREGGECCQPGLEVLPRETPVVGHRRAVVEPFKGEQAAVLAACSIQPRSWQSGRKSAKDCLGMD